MTARNITIYSCDLCGEDCKGSELVAKLSRDTVRAFDSVGKIEKIDLCIRCDASFEGWFSARHNSNSSPTRNTSTADGESS